MQGKSVSQIRAHVEQHHPSLILCPRPVRHRSYSSSSARETDARAATADAGVHCGVCQAHQPHGAREPAPQRQGARERDPPLERVDHDRARDELPRVHTAGQRRRDGGRLRTDDACTACFPSLSLVVVTLPPLVVAFSTSTEMTLYPHVWSSAAECTQSPSLVMPARPPGPPPLAPSYGAQRLPGLSAAACDGGLGALESAARARERERPCDLQHERPALFVSAGWFGRTCAPPQHTRD